MITNIFKAELQSIVDDSSRVLDVFSKTVTELTSINERVDEEAKKKITERDELTAQIELLASTKERNAKVIGKIENLLS